MNTIRARAGQAVAVDELETMGQPPASVTPSASAATRFEALLAAEGPAVAATLRIGRGWAGAIELDDVMQSTYLEAFLAHRAGQLDVRWLRPWLRRAAENNLRDAVSALRCLRRRPGNRRSLPGSGEEPVPWMARQAISAESAPSDGCERDELARTVHRELERLPPHYREALELVLMRGLAHADVGLVLGRSRGAVSLLQTRAISLLRRKLCPRAGRAPSAQDE